ncbi:MAG TPA: ATP synthase F1 subunit delta [Gemmataceae bacterium]|jgi:F-type H+-transporting ATPase subunit delta
MTENVRVHHETVFDDATRHIARIYAEALLAAADHRQQTDEVLEQLESLVRDVLNRDSAIALFLSSAVVGRDRKRESLRRAFEGKVNDVLFNFLLVLNDHDRLGVLREVAALMRDLYERRAGRMHVQVSAAAPMGDDQQDRLRHELREKFGREPILSVRVDPDLLGGLVVRVDDWVYDGSVRARLERIRNQLIERSSYAQSH